MKGLRRQDSKPFAISLLPEGTDLIDEGITTVVGEDFGVEGGLKELT